MLNPRSHTFANQDLRHRSFKRQHLDGADFSGADIRGCDFSRSHLVGANFAQAKAGQTPRQRLVWIAVAIAVTVLVRHAISRLVFGVLGQTPTDRAWGYSIALLISLGMAGGCSGVRHWVKQPRLNWLVTTISGMASGALIGFFYAGTSTKVLIDWVHVWFSLGENPAQNYPQAAIAGAVMGGLCMGIASLRFQSATLNIVVGMAGAVAAYGFAFLIGALAIAFLNTHHGGWGTVLSLVSLIYVWLTVKSLAIALQHIKHAPGTLFRNAHLTDANFAGASLKHTDFSGAIGAVIPQSKI